MNAKPALMFVATDVDSEHEAAWNRWYDGRHIPQRQTLPGFLTARRFEVAGRTGPSRRYLALYDLESAAALETKTYLSLSRPPTQNDDDREMLGYFRDRLRGIMELYSDASASDTNIRRDAPALLVVGLEPAPTYEEEFNAWYEEEHVPFLTKVPGVLGVRRFRRIRDDIPYLALWELEGPGVRKSDAWQKASRTPWTKRILSHCTWIISGVYRPRVTAATSNALRGRAV